MVLLEYFDRRDLHAMKRSKLSNYYLYRLFLIRPIWLEWDLYVGLNMKWAGAYFLLIGINLALLAILNDLKSISDRIDRFYSLLNNLRTHGDILV